MRGSKWIYIFVIAGLIAGSNVANAAVKDTGTAPAISAQATDTDTYSLLLVGLGMVIFSVRRRHPKD